MDSGYYEELKGLPVAVSARVKHPCYIEGSPIFWAKEKGNILKRVPLKLGGVGVIYSKVYQQLFDPKDLHISKRAALHISVYHSSTN